MESVGRMTRSRARALGATPLPALPTKTPEPKTTGRRGRKAAVQALEQTSQEAAPKQLHFAGEAAPEQPPTSEQPTASEDSNRDTSAAPSPDQVSSGAGAQDAGAVQLAEVEAHAETHDNPSVLMASPIILTAREHQFAANVAPLPMNLDQAAAAPEDVVAPPAEPTAPQPELLPITAANTPVPANTSPVPPADGPVPFEFDQAAVAGPPQPVAGSPLSMAAESPILSPLPTLASPQPMDASPLPAAMSPLPIAMSPMDASPLGAHLGQGAAAPSPLQAGGLAAVQNSPLAATTPLSFTSDAPRNGAAAFAPPLPASIPASPLSLTEEAVEQAVFSPMPEDGQCSPISLSGGADMTPQPTPPLQPQLGEGLEEGLQMAVDGDDEMMADATPLAEPAAPNAASPLTFASDRCAATPGTAPSPAPAFVGAPPDSVPHASASPAPAVSSFQGFAAVFPTPAGSELEPDSPSLAGLVSAAAAPSPSPSTLLMSATAATAPSPSTITLDHSAAACAAAAGSCMDQPSNAAGPLTAALTTPTPGAEGNLSAEAATAQHTTLASPMEGAGMPPAPAPTPECGAAPAWTLTQTPLANALAMSLAANAETRCEDADKAMEAEGEAEVAAEAEAGGADQPEQLPLGSPVEDMEMEDQPAAEPTAPSPAPQAVVQPLTSAATPVAVAPAKTPTLQGRSPAVGSVFRNSGATPKATTPSAAAPRSYVNVESRYNKTPTTGATAARARPSIAGAGATATPVVPTNAAAGAKSVKRVSIHTPEGPRSVALQRQVVPTPFRPKSAQAAAEAPVAEPQQHQQLPADEPQSQPELNPQAAAAAEERRAKAAERLKAIHATEQAAPAARATSGPGYLAPTQAFAVKSVKSKVESGSYDPRSLRQLKREVKEAAAKKEAKAALTEARSVKLTPKVNERQLPMPDDDEASDDQAEYDEGQENDLVAAMSGLEVAPVKNTAPVPLRGLPAPQGKHIRFNDKGRASESPQRTVLRGLPVAIGKYKRFD